MLLEMPDQTPEPEEPSSRSQAEQILYTNGTKPSGRPYSESGENSKRSNSWLKSLLGNAPTKNETETTTLRETLDELIEELEEDQPIAVHERSLITNILKLRSMKVTDVMIPRADICAIDVNTSQDVLFALFAEKQYSRLPVYRDTLDEVVGSIHIKDILAELAKGKSLSISDLTRSVPIVSPAMPILDLMLQMQQTTKHMAMVVDEFGGIDGLVTIGDIVESIVGEFDDEFHHEIQPELIQNQDGTIIVDARYDLEAFEERFGKMDDYDESDDIDTLGGLVFSIAGRIPARGEVITAPNSGVKFEVIDADPRRVSRLRIRNLPAPALAAE